jgi:Mycothiol maleylpyruvate isomerase N-terminal domain
VAYGGLNAAMPEWESFAHAVQARRPDSGTWCEGWTVRDVLIHQAGNADEMHRVLDRHIAGSPVETRAFEKREAPYRAMRDSDLWAAFITNCEQLADLGGSAVQDLSADTRIAWFGRQVSPGFFVEHMREELILHRWDLTGDDATATDALMQPWMTAHSVNDVGKPLLARGLAGLRLDSDSRIEARLRAPGAPDVLVSATATDSSVRLVPQEGEATIESDPAVRVLLLWGRRPADAARWHSQAGPDLLGRIRNLLSGY